MRNQKKVYRDYFDIDPEYFPVVNEKVIAFKPELWKKFFPHDSFVKLLKDIARVLDRKEKRAIWVEGAYGTGKSHAVLTVKKLLDASDDDAKEYFAKHRLSPDLYNNFQRIKNGGKILTVHRYGSSSIRGDVDLALAVQESVENALAEARIENQGGDSLKEAIIRYLSDPVNKKSFNVLAENYSDLFGGDDVDAILLKLRTYSGDALQRVMDAIFKVARERQIRAFSMTPKDLTKWLTETIRANGLKAIVFFWDEFTEYFKNNAHSLTGFQEIVELSETEPFYFVIVTHASSALFREGDQDYKKINGRFVDPHVTITLPENIAFQLMGRAMEKKDDAVLQRDWKEIVSELADRTKKAREIVKKRAKIADDEMLDVLPLHPFAALLLKHISTAFGSNQRSMFDFIKNDQGDDVCGFQWFIDNYGPDDDNPLLTIDMLWEFFYVKGRDLLAPDIRSVLDYFTRSSNRNLPDEDKLVLKTVLLLQAISLHAADAVELFVPSEKNLASAFEGTEMESVVTSVASRLVREKVLYQKPLGRSSSGSESFQYAAYVNEVSGAELDEFKKKVDAYTTTRLIEEELNDASSVCDSVELSAALKLRCDVGCASASDFEMKLRRMRGRLESEPSNKIPVLICFAKSDDESVDVARKIRAAVANGLCGKESGFVFIDAARTPLGLDAYEQYRDETAQSMYQAGKDNQQARQYAKNAKDVLAKWKSRVAAGEFVVYSEKFPDGERVANLEELLTALQTINKDVYPESPEAFFKAIPTMWQATVLKSGVECGAARKTQGTYKSGNALTKLDVQLGDAWSDPEYWKNRPNLWISRVKRAVDETIQKVCEKEARVSIRAIYDLLKSPPYGFMPCNLTAFVLGFVLREYVKDFSSTPYSWSDGITSDELDLEKLKEMVDDVIKLQNTPNNRYKDKYIVAMTEEEKAFNEISACAFDLSPNLCSSFENTRELVRNRMKDLAFPIWTLKSILATEPLRTERGVVEQLIDAYCQLANNANAGSGRVKSEVDLALEIGKESLKYPTAKEDLQTLLTAEKCVAGMQAYLREFEGGRLVALAKEIDDAGNYISALRHKFDADAANWVWNQETANQKIREVVLEYEIIAESNKRLRKTSTFADALKEWFAKCGQIRIAYQAAKTELGAAEPFAEILYKAKRQGTLLDSQKREFLDRLVARGEEFDLFYASQEQVFRKVCDYYLAGLSPEEVGKLFRSIPSGVFTHDATDYMNVVESKATDYRNNLGAERLKSLWKEKTDSESPRRWSQDHKLPILCLVPDREMDAAIVAFGAVNASRPDAASVEKAIAYLERATFYDDMRDPSVLDDRFRARVLEDYAVLLEDLAEVKASLDKSIDSDPYDWWFRLPEVRNKLRQMTEAKYAKGGYKKAYETIDRMSADDCKRYLKELIKNNMVVGIEIIKGK